MGNVLGNPIPDAQSAILPKSTTFLAKEKWVITTFILIGSVSSVVKSSQSPHNNGGSVDLGGRNH